MRYRDKTSVRFVYPPLSSDAFPAARLCLFLQLRSTEVQFTTQALLSNPPKTSSKQPRSVSSKYYFKHGSPNNTLKCLYAVISNSDFVDKDMNRVQPESTTDPIPHSLPAVAALSSGILLKSPSHESFDTDLSLMSLSSLGSEITRMQRSTFQRSKNQSGGESADSGDERRSPVIMDGGVGGWVRKSKAKPNVGLLQVPPEQFRSKRGVADDVLYEEENEAIRNCGALSSMLGLMRSFSTSDLYQVTAERETLRSSVSEMVLNSWKHYDMPYERLEYTSRSCSTWVAVGDVSTTSQLPSPQTLAGYAAEHPEITAIDFVRAINKKVRQMYIRRRLESTYKALERLTRSELSLDLPSIAVPVPSASGTLGDAVAPLPQFHLSTELGRSIRHELQISAVGFHGANKTLSLTVKDIERDKGKPLSKYERNMMIFNWLQSLDENAFDQLA